MLLVPDVVLVPRIVNAKFPYYVLHRVWNAQLPKILRTRGTLASATHRTYILRRWRRMANRPLKFCIPMRWL